IDDYCRAGFGPAAKTMRRYFDTLESVFTNMAQGEPRDESAGFTEEILANLDNLIAQAKVETVSDADARKRVEFIALGTKWTEIETRAHCLLVEPGSADPATVKRVLDERFGLMRELFHAAPLAVNVAAVSWGEDAAWSKLNYKPAP